VKKKYPNLYFIFAKVPHASVSYQGDKATIYLPADNPSEECLAHELLHLYVETKESSIVCCLFTGLIREKTNLKQIFSKDLIEHTTNCINHVKMLPYFVKMGYDKANFIADSSSNKCEIIYARKIKRSFKFLGTYCRLSIDSYIGKYFAMKADVSEIDYSIQFSILYETDKALYEILDVFWTKWLNIDIETFNVINYWSDDFGGYFIDSIEKWIKNKRIK
jgi:hypothetical protein